MLLFRLRCCLALLLARAAWAAPLLSHGQGGCADCTAASPLRYNDTELGAGSLRHLSGADVASAELCCAACRALNSCTVWTHAGNGSAATAQCWLKDNARGKKAEGGRVSGSCGPAPGPAPPPPTPPTPPLPPVGAAATIRGDGGPAPLARTDRGFASFTLDWWDPTQGTSPEGWGPHANILEIDLSSPKLRMLVAALGPGATLRIGGSLDKDVGYAMGPGYPGSLPYGSPACPAKLCLNASRTLPRQARKALARRAARTDNAAPTDPLPPPLPPKCCTPRLG